MKAQTGIVFSGGGVRGFAHVGVLQALEEFGIYPQLISGVSAGAVVGALYADGFNPKEMMDLFFDMDLYKLLQFRGFKLGLLSPDGLRKLLLKTLHARTFEELKRPLSITCTNIDFAKSEYFNSGVLIDPLMASLAFPLLIKPQLIQGCHYVDGGLMNNLPVQPLIGNCNHIIGVYVNPVYKTEKAGGTKNYMDRIVHLGLKSNMYHLIPNCDLFIEPPELSQFSLLKISEAKEIYKKGYEFTLQMLKAHSDLKSFQSG